MDQNGGEGEKCSMEKKVKDCLELSQDEPEVVSKIVVPALRRGEPSFYENFALRGIRVDRSEPGLVLCTLKVPPRLTDRAGNFAIGAIANLVDVVGSFLAFIDGLQKNVSVDISISYVSMAKLDDEVEITSKWLGRKGGYTGIQVLLRNKATGNLIAEGRHSMFHSYAAAKL